MQSYKLIAAFTDEEPAQRVAERLERGHVGTVHVIGAGTDGADRIAGLQAEMRDEVSEGWGGASIGFMTSDQMKGAWRGVLLGTVIGVALGAIAGVIWMAASSAGPSAALKVLFTVLAGGLGGATVGVIAGGSVRPRGEAREHPSRMLDAKRLSAEDRTLVTVLTTERDAIPKVRRLLDEAGAERVDAINGDGQPLPPQSGDR